MSEQRRGVAYGVLAYLLWGLFPLYWRLVAAASALEILAHRIVWSLLFVAALVAAGRRLDSVRGLLAAPRRLGLLVAAGILLGLNWGTYIHGVNSGQVLEASLGYFINPLMTVLLGVLVLRERLRRAQWIAISVGTVAVVVLAVECGRLPSIALILAASFALYGLAKKQAAAGAIESLTIETAVLAPPALAYLAALAIRGQATFGHVGVLHTTLLATSGLATAIPLLAFGAATIRIPLSTVGLLQYLSPAMQFLIGVAVFREPLPPSRIAGFALVWIALAILAVDGLRAPGAARRATIPGGRAGPRCSRARRRGGAGSAGRPRPPR